MVSDQEPRYRLVDSNGNVVGSLFAESDGTLKLQEGTSGNDNELILNTDGSIGVNAGTVAGNDLTGIDDAEPSEPTKSFDTWTTPSSQRPGFFIASLVVETDGTTRGFAQVQVDYSGGTISDREFGVRADPDAGSGVTSTETVGLPLPAGASIRVENFDDPNDNNIILDFLFHTY